jgi:enoyl-CoA hydratase/carnithine racemase
MQDSLVLHHHDARGVHTLTLNSPNSFNALGSGMIAAMQTVMDAVAADPQARALVIAANGKAFCPGHNLKDMAANPRMEYYQALFAKCSKMMVSIAKLPVPVVARVHAVATAAGCQLVVQCDLAVAASGARFATSGINFGLFCSTPSVPLVTAIPQKFAMEMLVTGEFIDAATALRYGLINRVSAPEDLDAEVEKLVQSILSKPRESLRLGKELVYRQGGLGLEAAYLLAGQTMAVNMMHFDAQEGVRAFVEKRAPVWPTSSN